MPKAPMFIAALSLTALAACTDPATFDPAAPDQNRTQQGALAGAVTGAILGAATSDNEARGAIIGAAVGAGAGAVIGQQVDRQEAALRQQLSGQVVVIRQGNQLIVRMPQDILFDSGSATLRPDLQGDIRSLAANLQRFPDSTVTVIGHTDSDGTAEFNQALSERRAASVAGILQQNGVAGFRINSLGRGESQPIADNLTPEGKRQNRRVDIVINPTA